MIKSKLMNARIRRGKPFASSKQHWADIWLPRLSHFAQVGLFLFTLMFSYFTVLPLYQKAVLEEAVAKKEIELGSLNKSLESTYIKLRTYTMGEFYIEAMPACGGLFIERGRTADVEPKKTRAELVFEIDVPTCLKDLISRMTSLSDLSPRDRKTFDLALDRISNDIALKRQQALKEYELAGAQVTDADWATLPSDSFRVRAQATIEKWQGGVPDLVARRKITRDVVKERVGFEYESFVREHVASLRSIGWESP